MTVQREIATRLLEEFPNTGSLTLARKAFKENKLVFPTLESARTTIRSLRGATGSKNRGKLKDKRFLRAAQISGDPWVNFPKGIVEAEWVPFKIAGPSRCLILSDIHVPFHDDKALFAAIEYGKQNNADTILLNGDIADCHAVSKYQSDPRKRNFGTEVSATRTFLAGLRKTFPQARIVFKLGNHEERWEKFLFLKAPEILGVEEFRFDKIFHLQEYGIECVRDQQRIHLGRLAVMHGHEWRGGISSPVSPARGLYNKAKVSALAGHLHQTSQSSESDLEGHVISTWSAGCLCDLHPLYARVNKWNHGFAFVTTDKQGVFDVQNLRIIEGKVY